MTAAPSGAPGTAPAPAGPAGGGTGVLDALWRFRRSSAVIALGCLLLSAAAGLALAERTTATASLSLTTPSSTNLLAPGSSSDAALSRYTAQRAAYATSDAVLERVVDAVPGTTLAGLRGQVRVESASGTNTLTVSVDAGDAATSAEVADAVVAAYQGATTAQVADLTDAALAAIAAGTAQVQERLDASGTGPAASSAATTLSGLEQEANTLRTDQAVFADGVEFTEAATVVPAALLPVREAALGLLVGLGLAGVVAWWRADGDRLVEDPAGAAAAAGAPLLGTVVVDDSLLHGLSLGVVPAPAYRPVLPALALRASAGVVLVTAARREEGASATALHLAVTAARQGARVLLVDADAAPGSLTGALFVDRPGEVAPAGFRELATGAAPTGAAAVRALLRPLPLGGGAQLLVLGAGAAVGVDGSEPDVQLGLLQPLLEVLRGEFDLVVLDAAPLPTGGLPAALARLADSALVVVRRGTPAFGVEQISQLLALYATPVSGVLMTFGRSQRSRRRAGPAGRA